MRGGRRRAAGSTAALVVVALSVLGAALPPPVAAAGGLAYSALGDSYAAGPGSGGEDGTPCRRSANAYPPQFARAGTRYGLTDFAACSSATIAVVEASQLGRVGSARLVTVTAGGNDARFAEIIADCMRPRSRCRGDFPDEDQRIDSLEAPLHRLYGKITAAAPRAQLLVANYPQILRPHGTCGSTWTLTPEDVDWFRSEFSHMNAVIGRAARGVARTAVVDVENAFAGHELCTAEEWALGGRPADVTSSFHPNPRGFAAIASSLRAAAP